MSPPVYPTPRGLLTGKTVLVTAAAGTGIGYSVAKRAAEERLAIAEESMTTGTGARLPWEAVRDWFHEAGNYVDRLDHAAETLATQPGFSAAEALQRHGITLATDSDEDAPLARFDGATLTLNAALPPESRRFLIAHRLAATAFAREIEAIVAGADVVGAEARRLLAVGLANYAAGALIMPYAAFRAEALAAPRYRPVVPPLYGEFRTGVSPALDAPARRGRGRALLFLPGRYGGQYHQAAFRDAAAIRTLRRGVPAVACA